MKVIKSFFFASLFVISSVSVAEGRKYRVDTNHANVVWSADHFGFSSPSGKFTDVTGSITFDESKPENSSVDIIIKTDSINTGIEKFDDHLRSVDFFNVKDHPNATFVAKKIKVIGKNKAKITGDLTLLGITKPVTLDTKLNKSALHPYSQKPTIGFSATTSILRSQFGMNYGIPGVSDKVNLSIELEANAE